MRPERSLRLDCVQEMQGLAVTPNLITWTSAIEACAKSQPRRGSLQWAGNLRTFAEVPWVSSRRRSQAEDFVRQALGSGLEPDAKLIRPLVELSCLIVASFG